MNIQEWEDDINSPNGMLALAGVDFETGMKDSVQFRIGDVFQTLGGNTVECVELSHLRGYECAKFSDGGWRYNRPHDRGRCTGGMWVNPKNIIPKFPDNLEFIQSRFDKVI